MKDQKSPIFVCGLRKSGTSLVKRLLDGHSELFVCPANELHIFKYTDHVSFSCPKKIKCNNWNDTLDNVAGEHFISRLANPDAPDYCNGFSYENFLRTVEAEKPVYSLQQILTALHRAFQASLPPHRR